MNRVAANTLPTLPPAPHFEMLGGEAGVVRLVNAFFKTADWMRNTDLTAPASPTISTPTKESS